MLQSARPAIDRGIDRRITFGGVLVAAFLLGLAGLSGLGSASGGAVWLPLHLAMAGAAGTAIASVLPFFTTALAQVRPAAPWLRLGALGLVAGGALIAGLGMNGAGSRVAAAGGLLYVAGIVALAGAALLPLRAMLGFKFRIVHLAYAVALAQVGIGVGLATAMLAGWSPIASAWGALKPAHGWLNVFGFVTVVIAASLVHLAPTVAGARIRARRTSDVALVGLIAGAPLVALGLASGFDAIARVGATVELLGAAGLVAHGASVQRDRGAWTSDPGWHRFAGLSLLAAPVWLFVVMVIAGGRILWLGADPAAWSVGLIAVPLVGGWIGQVLIGSLTHLVPSIGPGDQAVHAVQRRWLGRAASARWLAWNGGVTLASAGVFIGQAWLAVGGGALIGGALVSGLGLLAVAVGFSSWSAPVAAGAARR